ncbi:MAG: AlbA family DNA-binding domain-containing protein, partial [Acidimicrobiales bacterium]
DIARDSVRPPLLYEAAVHEVDGGYILVVDVEPSGLGPYMIIAYDEFRFWTRHGKSNSPMSEAEVRDAYELALRWADRQAARWKDRSLPLRSGDVNSVLPISAIPREPAADILDLRQLDLDALRPPAFIQDYLRHGGLNPALHGLRRWADGFTYDPEPSTSTTRRAW